MQGLHRSTGITIMTSIPRLEKQNDGNIRMAIFAKIVMQ